MINSALPGVVVIAGPTASGKSALALDVAEAFDGTIINADSMQVYRELRVLTARPTAADEARAPHRLFGTVPARDSYSVGRWLKEATAEIKAVRAASRLPLVAGGTGLYLKALMEGLTAVPDIPGTVRAEARALHAELGGGAFRARLAEEDPVFAEAIPEGDSQRLIRAFEVVRATGRSLADWRDEHGSRPVARFCTLVLAPPRHILYAAIDRRFTAMMENGALAEVKALASLGLNPALPAMKAVGVAPLRRHLSGEISLDEAEEAARRASRNYAKRQMTWLRHQISGAMILNAQYSRSIAPKIFSFIRQFLLTGQT